MFENHQQLACENHHYLKPRTPLGDCECSVWIKLCSYHARWRWATYFSTLCVDRLTSSPNELTPRTTYTQPISKYTHYPSSGAWSSTLIAGQYAHAHMIANIQRSVLYIYGTHSSEGTVRTAARPIRYYTVLTGARPCKKRLSRHCLSSFVFFSKFFLGCWKPNPSLVKINLNSQSDDWLGAYTPVTETTVSQAPTGLVSFWWWALD